MLAAEELVDRRKAVARDILARLDAKKFYPSSTYLRWRSSETDSAYLEEDEIMDHYFQEEEKGKVQHCWACQRGAMAMSMLTLGYDGDPKDATREDGFESVLASLYPLDQIVGVEKVFEGYCGHGLNAYMSLEIDSPSLQECRMRFICKRMLEEEDGLFRLTDKELNYVDPYMRGFF